MSLSMEFENFFPDNDLAALMFADVPMTTLIPSSSDLAVESRFSTEPMTSSSTSNRKPCYSTNSAPSSCRSDSVSSGYGSESLSEKSVTSLYNVESVPSSFSSNFVTPGYCGKSVTSSFSGESLTSFLDDESVPSSYSGESATSQYSSASKTQSYSGESVTSQYSSVPGTSSYLGETLESSCTDEYVTSPCSSLSETLHSYSELDNMYFLTAESDDSFSDLIMYDDVFEPIETTEVERRPNQHENNETTILRGLCQSDARPIPQHPEEPPTVTYTPRYAQYSNTGFPKAKRKRSQNSRQRSAANVRERNRMVYLNKAFNVLKSKLPGLNNKRLSRIDTLRTAISYIKCMKDITS